MGATVELLPAHWIYLVGVAAIIITMLLRANVVVPSVIATFLVVLAWSGNFVTALGSIFDASFVAAKELFNIFLVIALVTALLNSLKELRSDVRMVEPFRSVMKNGHIAFFVLALITYAVSLFFWPTPAVPLVSAVLLPAAIAAGLPPIAGAVAIAIAGQGMALSSDYIVGVAPGISAKASGALVTVIADRALVLSLVTGSVALTLAYFSLRRRFVPPDDILLAHWQAQVGNGFSATLADAGTMHKPEIARGTSHDQPTLLTECDVERELQEVERRRVKWSKLFAVLTPLAFLVVVVLMVLPLLVAGTPAIKGGQAASMVGGMAALLMILATLSAHGPRRMLDVSAAHVTDGFVFAFKAMGSVLPIAGFFFLGASGTAASILGAAPEHTPSLLFDLVNAAQDWIPQSKYLVAFRCAHRRHDHGRRRFGLRGPAVDGHAVWRARSRVGRRRGDVGGRRSDGISLDRWRNADSMVVAHRDRRLRASTSAGSSARHARARAGRAGCIHFVCRDRVLRETHGPRTTQRRE